MPRRGCVGWLALLVVAHGCGYALVRTGGSLGGVRSVAIPTPRNDSWEPGAEYVVAEALRHEFLRRKAVRLVEDPSGADLVLRGRVSRVGTRTASVDSLVLALEYEITLELELEAERSGGGEVPIDAAFLRESERYLASADAEVTRKNRQEALRQVASVLAARVYVALRETLGEEPGRSKAAERPRSEPQASEGGPLPGRAARRGGAERSARPPDPGRPSTRASRAAPATSG